MAGFTTWKQLGIAVAIAFVTLGGCRTPYQRSGALGGYSDYQAGADTIYVSYSGNGYTGAETIIRYWHLRAAEVCGGSDQYEVVARSDRSSTTEGASQTSFSGSATTRGNYTTYSGTARHSAPIRIIKHTASGYVRCVSGGSYDSARNVWDKRGNARPGMSASSSPPPPDESRDDALQVSVLPSSPAIELTTAAPAGAVGYLLGQTRNDVESICRAATKEISPVADDVVRCSGTAAEFGSDAVVLLRFCEGTLCQIDVSFPPYGTAFHHWFKRYDEIYRALAANYGKPTTEVRRLPSECGRQHRECFSSGYARLFATWEWQAGPALKLASGRSDGFVHVNYFSVAGLRGGSTVDVGSEPKGAATARPYPGL